MKLARRRKSTSTAASLDGVDEEQASVSRSFRPDTADPSSRRRTKDTAGGLRKVKSLYTLLKPCLLACLICVIGVSFLAWSGGKNTSNNDQKSVSRNLPAIQINQTAPTPETTTFTELAPTLPAPPTGNISSCSCWNTTAPSECCERTIFRAHKFGTFLVDTLFDPFLHPTSKHRFSAGQFPKNASALPTTCDYRHVAVTRNWYDAIVSGYLYHKAGYECWMNARGERKRIVRRGDWESQLMFVKEKVPPRNNRSICTYLEQESEENGMRILMDIAVSKWYKGVVPYWKSVQERLQHDSEQHSLFVCYEDLVDPFQQEAMFHQVINWMFPTGEARSVSITSDIKRSLEEQQHNLTIYSGGHATQHDPKLRARLRRLVERLDGELFNNTVAASNVLLGCGNEVKLQR